MNLLQHHLPIIPFLVLNILGHYLDITQFPLPLDFAYPQQLALLAIILGLTFLPLSGTNIYATSSGVVSYLDFNGANGYTIMISNNNTIFSYSHISPNFVVNIGDSIIQNQLIATVGPKYINSIPNNPYQDSSGHQTNGATTGCHLHFSIKIDGNAIDPLQLFHSSTYHPQNCPSLVQ